MLSRDAYTSRVKSYEEKMVRDDWCDRRVFSYVSNFLVFQILTKCRTAPMPIVLSSVRRRPTRLNQYGPRAQRALNLLSVDADTSYSEAVGEDNRVDRIVVALGRP